MKIVVQTQPGSTPQQVEGANAVVVYDDAGQPVAAVGRFRDGIWFSDARDPGFQQALDHLGIGDTPPVHVETHKP